METEPAGNNGPPDNCTPCEKSIQVAVPSLLAEMGLQARLGLSNIGSLALGFGATTVSSILIGRLDRSDYMAGLGLGMMTVNVTGWAFLVGLLSGQETLSSEAFGAKNYPRVGSITLTAFLAGLLPYIGIVFLWMFVAPVLELLGQPPAAIGLAAKYTRISIATYPAVLLSETFRRYWMTQQVNTPTFLGGAVQLSAACGLAVALVRDMNVEGIAIASLISMYCFAMVEVILAKVGPWARRVPKASFPSLGQWRQAILNLKQLLLLGLPGVGMTALEWGSYEIAAFVAGSLGELPLAGHNVIYSVVPLLYTIPLGISFVTSARIAGSLGKGCPEHARVSALAGLASGVICAVVNGTVLIAGRHLICRLYTDSTDIQSHALPSFIWAGFMIAFDSLQCMGQALMRGCGKQKWGFPVIFISMYLVCLPLAIVLSHQMGFGLEGVWMGMVAGYIAMDCMFLVAVTRLDWGTLSGQAVERARRPVTETDPLTGGDPFAEAMKTGSL